MLVLSRRVGEAVRIGTNVTVRIVGVKGNQIRLGIQAPGKVSVHREEVANRIRFEDPARNNGTGAPSGNSRHDRQGRG